MIKTGFATLLLVVAGSASAQSHLDQVLESKVLTVCITGDYRPYSVRRADGHYEGIDVTMAQSLAKSLDAQIKWVPVTWKTLMQDFLSARCDIAVGGISVTLKRQQTAWFASALGSNGKIPLVRCADKAKYRTVDQLNRPSVRLIEPAGGTNEAFARDVLPKANLTLFHDNVTIFRQLVDKKADVMITDASEAQYQQKHYPELCAVNPQQPMQYGEKAWMLPRDDMSWKLYVDQWLHLSLATGEYQKAAGEWLSTAQ
ncbi:transporter substrate-binding domain-containing protein [Erwinia psidii]|uniref:ArtI protein n=1 Tax=Erwinia psidii TaxID=69224 RepID=A0A3N6RZ92_9GAMM|nr:transporter substrate-binding domain-containing protein [Erwinia psidii]MCX8957900.1 ArtI protein [Erwinia psidii]MCX8960951.1 ArtI protein [Erwinia psidii]MCX8964806.1 ArtI protein [Erwinia psidii]RQM38514.1 ArtI protein [Erwinia psidii]